MVEQARKFKFDSLLTFLDDSLCLILPPNCFCNLGSSKTVTVGSSSNAGSRLFGNRAGAFSFGSSVFGTSIPEDMVEFCRLAVHFESELPRVSKRICLLLSVHLRKIVTLDLQNLLSRQGSDSSGHNRDVKIFKSILENASLDFFKKLVDGLLVERII